jgi:hypothetical protein
MNTALIIFIITALLLSLMGAHIICKPKVEISDIEVDASQAELTNTLPIRYFYCIQTKEELPEWDPLKFAKEIGEDAHNRAALYTKVDFPLHQQGNENAKAKKCYVIERMNYTHLSATLNQMILLLNTLGNSYPDVLQLRDSVIRLREQVDDEHKRRRFLCAANRFTRRRDRAIWLAYGGSVPFHKRHGLTWTEINDVFVYTDEELLS